MEKGKRLNTEACTEWAMPNGQSNSYAGHGPIWVMTLKVHQS